MNDLDNTELINALKDLDENCVEIFDDFIAEQTKINKDYQCYKTVQKFELNFLIYFIKSWKKDHLPRPKSSSINNLNSPEFDQNNNINNNNDNNNFELRKSSSFVDINNNRISSDKSCNLNNQPTFDLYIGHIPNDVDQYEIRKLFEKQGTVNLVKIKTGTYGSNFRFGFVSYSNEESALNAIKNVIFYK